MFLNVTYSVPLELRTVHVGIRVSQHMYRMWLYPFLTVHELNIIQQVCRRTPVMSRWVLWWCCDCSSITVILSIIIVTIRIRCNVQQLRRYLLEEGGVSGNEMSISGCRNHGAFNSGHSVRLVVVRRGELVMLGLTMKHNITRSESVWCSMTMSICMRFHFSFSLIILCSHFRVWTATSFVSEWRNLCACLRWNSSSAGELSVVLWGVDQYSRRKMFSCCFQGIPCVSATRTALPSVLMNLSAVALAWGQSGVIRRS